MVRYRKKKYNSRNNLTNQDRVNAYRYRKRILKDALSNATSERETTQYEENESTYPSISDNFDSNRTVRELLRSWVNCHGITTIAVNDLLKILIFEGIFKSQLISLENMTEAPINTFVYIYLFRTRSPERLSITSAYPKIRRNKNSCGRGVMV